MSDPGWMNFSVRSETVEPLLCNNKLPSLLSMFFMSFCIFEIYSLVSLSLMVCLSSCSIDCSMIFMLLLSNESCD